MVAALCLFCGSRPGADPAHAALAAAVGAACATRGVTLVYGGGRGGLMGVAARAALAGGGRVVGILPACLADRELAQPGLSELVVVDTLHARKAAMFARSDAVACLPGGLGTLDELCEVMTWKNLGLHARPLLLVGGAFWDPFLALLAHLEASGFAYPAQAGLTQAVADAAALAAWLDAAR